MNAAIGFLPQHGWFEQVKEDDVHIYQCAFEIPNYQDGLFQALAVPWVEKLAKAVDKRKSEFLAGRFCAKQALARLGIEHFTIEADKNRCPQWPDGIKGAITHSNSRALAAVTRRADVLGIGIDIENIMPEKTMSSVRKAIVQGSENDFLDSEQYTACEATSLIFSIKESFFKAAYPSTGHYFDFDAVTVNTLDRSNSRFSLTVNQDLNPQVRPGAQYQGQFIFIEDKVLSLLLI